MKQTVVIVGGGTAGWMSASLLAKTFEQQIDITLVESDDIGTIGVGEATIPPIIHFNEELGIDFNAFIKHTKATFKLGIQFENWGQIGERYMHAFGDMGKSFPLCDFVHFWVKANQNNLGFGFWDYSLNYQVATRNAFADLGKIPQLNMNGLAHAFHFDAGLYANFLRNYSEQRGVRRIEGTVREVLRSEHDGGVKSVKLSNGTELSADLFIDCSGMRGLLIKQALNTGYEDWSHWLPADRAIAVPTEKTTPIVPYTRSIAHPAGWQWRIPLQHRTGNGIVYSSKYLSDDEAEDVLLKNLDGAPLHAPRRIKFQTGRTLKQWNKNVVAIGLSSGFLEPLESTSIHLIQSAIVRLIKMMPHLNGNTDAISNEYNRQSAIEFEKIRDFIILHYWLNQRDDSQFWIDCRNMNVPESLKNKRDLFERSGLVFRESDELFTKVAWQQVMIGQNLVPQNYHGVVNKLSDSAHQSMMQSLKEMIEQIADKAPSHESFLLRLQ